MHKGRIARDIGDRAEGMAGGEHHLEIQIADGKGFALGKHPVKTPRRIKCVRQVVKIAPDGRDFSDLLTDRRRRAGLLLQPRGGGHVVGMGVGVEDHRHLQPLTIDQIQYSLCAVCRSGCGLRIKVQNHVDQRGLPGRGAGSDILDGSRFLFIKPPDIRRGRAVGRAVACDRHNASFWLGCQMGARLSVIGFRGVRVVGAENLVKGGQQTLCVFARKRIVDRLPIPPPLHQPVAAQKPEMLGNHAFAHPKGLCECADRPFAFDKRTQDHQAIPAGHRLEQRLSLVRVFLHLLYLHTFAYATV